MNHDTVHLLRQCDSGLKMAVASIGDVLDSVRSDGLREHLEASKAHHQALLDETDRLLARNGCPQKSPGKMARTMAKAKTDFMLTIRPADSTVAGLMTDGCSMGIKTLSHELNCCRTADVQSRDLTRRLIGIEDALSDGLRPYL